MFDRRKIIVGVLVCLLLLLTQGCASIVSGKGQEMSFTSVPDGATVTVSGRVLGVTPMTVRMDRDNKQAVTFEKDGYKPLTLPLTTTLNGWFWGNILLIYAGPFGSTTDGASGAVYEYSPSQYNVTLQSKEAGAKNTSAKDDAKVLIIVNYKNLLAELNGEPGPYLAALYNLLKIPPEKQDDALKNIKMLSVANKDIPTFADVVTNTYLK